MMFFGASTSTDPHCCYGWYFWTSRFGISLGFEFIYSFWLNHTHPSSPTHSRIWDHLLDMVQQYQTTIVITTHYIEEARQAHTVSALAYHPPSLSVCVFLLLFCCGGVCLLGCAVCHFILHCSWFFLTL